MDEIKRAAFPGKLNVLARLRQGPSPYLFIGALALFLYLFFQPFALSTGLNAQRLTPFLLLLIVLIVGVSGWLWARGAFTADHWVVVILLVGLVMRFGYVFYTSAFARQHDMGGFEDHYGHYTYIAHYITDWLPITDSFWQHHHPPLYHFLAGKLIALGHLVLDVTREEAAEGLQLVGAALTGMMSVLFYRILHWGGAGRRAILIAMLLFCLHPNFYVMSGSVNNDNLMIFWVIAALFLTLRWHQQPSWRHTLLLALAIGCGMMTKLSAFLIAPVAAIVFLAALTGMTAQSKGKVKSIVPKLAAFGAISLPLGLWYPVYAWRQFGMIPGWIPGPGESQNISRYSVFQRLFTIPLEQFEYLPYCFSGADYNIPMYVAKCSLFGEYRYSWPVLLPNLLVCLNLVLMALSLVALVYVMFTSLGDEENVPFLYILYGAYISHLFGYIFFCFSMPYICSMDFRYGVITLLGGAAFIGLGADRLAKRSPRIWRWLRGPLYGLIGLFVLISQYLYLTVGQ